ncbi:MAG: hypothetical protein WBQ25_07225 [Nitrososphaeraceae archaeon]
MNPTKKILALVLAMMLFGSTIGISNVIAKDSKNSHMMVKVTQRCNLFVIFRLQFKAVQILHY